MTYRNRKLLDIAHDAPCFLNIANTCNSGGHPSVPCHSNSLRHGRGVGHKSSDCFHVPGCGPCHDWLDKGPAPRQEKDDAFMSAFERYILWLWTNDKIKVA